MTYDAQFLGPDLPPVPVPDLPGADTVLLGYEHFSVRMRPERRLAAVSSVCIDGASLVDVERGRDRWRFDERMPQDQQAGEELYARNDLDRGHLTRRRDPVWGPSARQANTDTFHYTNAAPQAAAFNQGKELWNGLEDHLLEAAEVDDRRLVVHTGPVLAADDPVYRGFAIPQHFFKVVAFAHGGGLACTAYLLDQSPQLDAIDLRSLRAQREAAGEPPPLGPFRTFQVAALEVVELTALDFGPLPPVDRFVASGVAAGASLRRELSSYDDIVL